MSMFEDVSTMNVAFGNAQGNPLAPEWDRLKNQAKNIGDEFRELMEKGIDVKNMTEVRDGICDILVFTLGLAHMAGLPVEEDMAAVYESNMSKFCKTDDEVVATVSKYRDLGVEVYVEGDFPMKRVKSSKEQTDINGKADYRKGKMLKSVAFKEPVFSRLVGPDHCSDCGSHWIEHDFGVPAPICPSSQYTLACVPKLENLHG